MEDCVDELKVEEEEKEENGTLKSDNAGGLIERIISHLPAAIAGISDASAAGGSSHGGEDGDKPEEKKAEEALPVDAGPDPEEATILISIIHD